MLRKPLQSLLNASILRRREPIQQRRAEAWFRARGDETYRLDYRLHQNSVVVDAGGYQGQWTDAIERKFHCTIHVFEPVRGYALQIQERFQGNDKIHVHAVGLDAEDADADISLLGDQTSTYRREAVNREMVHLVKAADFFRSHGIDPIDLMKINIEGAEYNLLDHLIEDGFIGRIKNIQVQFHDFYPRAHRRRRRIRRCLKRTHRLTWQFPFVWENWEIK